ncbi:MAG: ribosome assembly cofactor RimP [Bacteroidales bacterium]|nr:ribosome assembly cofactor RimP [Bacteroidales bacterium]
MLDKTKIEKIVNESVTGTDKFLVDISVSSANVVDVFVDGDKGISIQECVKISRLIESSFDREVEDYELRVSSPGLSKPFKMIRQYKKYLNREIEIINNDDKKIKGVLKSVSENGFELERKKDKKGKEIILEEYLFDGIKVAKPFVGF